MLSVLYRNYDILIMSTDIDLYISTQKKKQ